MIYEDSAEKTIVDWLLKFSDQEFRLTDLVENADGERALADFLQLAVTNHWLYKV